MKKLFLFLLFGVIVFGAGCTPPRSPGEEAFNKPAAERPDANTSTLRIMALAPGSFNASIEYDAAGKFISEWLVEGPEIVINAGYFDTDNSPAGYLIINKKRIGSKMFDQDKSALLIFNQGAVSIRDLTKTPLKPGEVFDYAVQSYPLLIRQGVPWVKTNSRLRARRTALGLDNAGNVYIIIDEFANLSLYEFGAKLLATKIPFTDVVNLDGGPSTGLYSSWHSENFLIDSLGKVPSIIRFKKK